MIPSIQFGNSPYVLAFLHANGYPPECYAPLLTQLGEKYTVIAPALRALWPNANPKDIQDWTPLSTDLLQFADEQKLGKLTAIGHSVGATSLLRAALRWPERFERIVLLEPVLFPPAAIIAWSLIRALGLGYRLHPLVPAALRRRRNFENLEKMTGSYRTKKIFRYFSNEALQALTSGLTQPAAAGGYELRFPPEWEARIYVTGLWRDMELWQGLKNLAVPTLILRGAESDTFTQKTAQSVARITPRARIEAVAQSSHLMPMERPETVSRLVQDFLAQ